MKKATISTIKSKPLIGLTTYGRFETREYHLPEAYVLSVREAGGIPVLIPPGELYTREYCRFLDGVILTGGGDIDSQRYNGKQHETLYNIDKERDEGELMLAKLVLEYGIPTLAICRGMQILNVLLGGTLIEHIPDKYGDIVSHRLPPRIPASHKVEIFNGSKISAIFASTAIEIVSWHHQALDKIPDSFTVTARAPDGVIEAVEMNDHPWLVGVQWHPELAPENDRFQKYLFDAFVHASSTINKKVHS